MAARTASTQHRESAGRGLKPRAMPFVGLLLMPPGALVAGLAVHMSVQDNVIGLGLTALVIGSATTVLALVAWAVGRHRELVIRVMVTATVVLAGLGEAVTVVVGFQRWWSTTFVLVGLLVACAWGLTRIDALRKDPKASGEEHGDPLTKKLGLENTGFGKPKQYRDEHGDVTRIEVPVHHGPGETAEVIQGAVSGIESVADQAMGGDVPRGRSRAVPSEGAGRSTLVIITKDVLKGLISYPGPSSAGGCITEPLMSGVYEDQQLVFKFIAGGTDEVPNPSSYGFMGMTRTGKTLNAQVNAMEMMSRRNVIILWFDTIKGSQTVRPLRRGLGLIVASDDPKSFRKGMKALQELIKWRADRLGECGYRSWTPAAATDPRLMMPLVVAHFEECDALTDIAGEEMVFIASKGLSCGVVGGYSLQRADSNSMPTGLRFNVGNWSCFGCGDDYSAGFALSSATIDAGAHPENWKQSKPGYFYTEGIGIDQQRWPVPAKSYFATDEQMEAHAEVWGSRMMPLDQGSGEAMGAWFVDALAASNQLVTKWDAGPNAAPVVHDGVSTSTNTAVAAGNDDEDELQAIKDEIDEIGDELKEQGAYDGLDPEALTLDPGRPVPPVAAGQQVSWRSSKADAPSREAAVEALHRALLEIVDDPTSGDDEEDDERIRRESDGTLVFTVAAITARYTFRSRPWFSTVLAEIVRGEVVLPGLQLEATDTPGEYRLRAASVTAGAGHSA